MNHEIEGRIFLVKNAGCHKLHKYQIFAANQLEKESGKIRQSFISQRHISEIKMFLVYGKVSELECL